MESFSLTSAQARNACFQQGVLANLRYWQSWLEDNQANLPATDRERTNIIRAISFACKVDAAWPLVHRLVLSFSRSMERSGHWEAWNWVILQAMELARRYGDTAVAVELSGLLARLLKREGNFQQAIRQHRQTIHLARQIGDTYNEARAWTNMGYLYIEQGQWQRAEILCCHALKLFEQLDSQHGLAHTENHLGILYTRQWRWELAEQHLQKACALWQTLEDRHGLMYGLLNMGMLYNEMEQPGQALPVLEQALHWATHTGEQAEAGAIYQNMSDSYLQLARPDQAEAHARRAEAIFKRYDNWLNLPLAWLNLGHAPLRQGKLEQAAAYFKAALEKCKQSAYKYGEIKATMGWIDYELARDDHTQAALWVKQLEQLVNHYNHSTHHHHLQSVLTKYRRSLQDKFR
jgi:tetratricopeptide (TPR) repeat protein